MKELVICYVLREQAGENYIQPPLQGKEYSLFDEIENMQPNNNDYYLRFIVFDETELLHSCWLPQIEVESLIGNTIKNVQLFCDTVAACKLIVDIGEDLSSENKLSFVSGESLFPILNNRMEFLYSDAKLIRSFTLDLKEKNEAGLKMFKHYSKIYSSKFMEKKVTNYFDENPEDFLNFGEERCR